VPLLGALAGRWETGPHRPVAFGAAAAAAGGAPFDAALAEVQGALSMPVGAAVRLLGLDPVDGAAILAALATRVDEVAGRVAAIATVGGTLPARAAPMQEVCAERHARRQGVLFAS